MVARIKKNMVGILREVRAKKIGKAKAAPELKSIPPTTAAFHENIKRAHILQASIWNNEQE